MLVGGVCSKRCRRRRNRRRPATICGLGEDCHYELINGEILPKPGYDPAYDEEIRNAAPKQVHAGAAALAFRAVIRFHGPPSAERGSGWKFFSELHVDYGGQVYCHDLCAYYFHRAPKPGWTRVRPNWVCEIMSPGDHKRDLVDKLTTLQRVGVEHYWVIDCHTGILQIFRHVPHGYVLAVAAGPDSIVHAEPFDFELDTATLFND